MLKSFLKGVAIGFALWVAAAGFIFLAVWLAVKG
jgi:hypothetical protein